MTEPRETSSSKSVERVVHHLDQHDLSGALSEINKEVRSNSGQPERTKKFLSTLTKECQEKGFLPELAVDFGKKHFKDLDFNNDGHLTANELGHVLNDQKMQAALTPFEREMSAYLLANAPEIEKTIGGTGLGITTQGLDSYLKESGTKYDAFVNGQQVKNSFGKPAKFDAIDSNKDGFLTDQEIQDQLEFNTRAIALPGLSPESAKEITEQNKALQFMKDNQKKIASAVNDTWDNSISRADISKYAEINSNPRLAEKIPTIGDNIVASQKIDGKVDMSRGNHMSEVIMKYGTEHHGQLDLDNNGKISRAELNKILDSPTWKQSLSQDERKVVEAMRSRFDQIAIKKDGEFGITPNSLVYYNNREENARHEESKSAKAAEFIKQNSKTIDIDKNGWISPSELQKTQDFYTKALSLGMVADGSKAQVAENMKSLDYLKEHSSEITSAWRGSDMTPEDIQKYADKKKGKLADVFTPTEKPIVIVEVKPIEKPVTKEKPFPLPNFEIKPWEKPSEQKPFEKPVVKPNDHPDMICDDKVCKPKPKLAESPEQKPEKKKHKPLIDESELSTDPIKPSEKETKTPKAKEETAEPAKEHGKPADKSPQTEAEKSAKQALKKPAQEKDEFDKYIDKYYKYTEKNYAQAIKDAHESGKPVVLVMGSQKTPEAVQAGAQATMDGKAVVVYVDVNKIDANSLLGKYAKQILETHNRANGSNDQCVTTVFNVGKDQSGNFQPQVAIHTDWGRKTDYSNMLRRQVSETAAYGRTAASYQQYYYNNSCVPGSCR